MDTNISSNRPGQDHIPWTPTPDTNMNYTHYSNTLFKFSELVTQTSTTRPSLSSRLPSVTRVLLPQQSLVPPPVIRVLFPPTSSRHRLCMSPDREKQSGDTPYKQPTSSTKSDPKSLEEAEKSSVQGSGFPDGGLDAWIVSNQVLSLWAQH